MEAVKLRLFAEVPPCSQQALVCLAAVVHCDWSVDVSACGSELMQTAGARWGVLTCPRGACYSLA